MGFTQGLLIQCPGYKFNESHMRTDMAVVFSSIRTICWVKLLSDELIH